MFLRKKLSFVHWLGIVTVVIGLSVVGVSDVLFSKTPEGSHTNTEKITGDALILVAMLFTSFQVRIQQMNIDRFAHDIVMSRSSMKNVSLANTIYLPCKLSDGKAYSVFLHSDFFSYPYEHDRCERAQYCT
jgi:hypothetical protein